MVSINVPYSKEELEINIPEENLNGILKSGAADFEASTANESDLVRQALAAPVGTETLSYLVRNKQNIVIISSDHTRPVPSHITMPILLETIRSGNENATITILIATGYHRPTTKDELISKYGAEIVAKENIVVHNAFDDSSLVNLGTLPSGGELWLNKLAIESDLLIAEGFIEPHFFAGFSGGRKSVLPGIAGAKTVLANPLLLSLFQATRPETGNLKNNPIHQDMRFAAQQAKLAFILNVVINEKKEVIKAFAGHFEKAHLEGCEFVRNLSQVNKIESDIVIVTNGGYPLDQNIYQAVKGMTAAEATCKPDGVIIMLAACEDGHGGESFYREMATAQSPEAVLEKVMTIDRNDTRPDQWEFQILARILAKYKVILVTDRCDPQMIKDMHLDHAFNFDEALAKAFKIKR